MAQTQLFKIPIKAAVLHFGRKPDGYGGKAALARALGITPPALDRWRSGKYLPTHHAKTLVDDFNCRHLVQRGKR